MKWFIILILVASSVFFISNKSDNCLGGRCSPNGTCYACKNCSGCKHCAKEGGECSVCATHTRKVINTRTKASIKKTAYKKTKRRK